MDPFAFRILLDRRIRRIQFHDDGGQPLAECIVQLTRKPKAFSEGAHADAPFEKTRPEKNRNMNFIKGLADGIVYIILYM